MVSPAALEVVERVSASRRPPARPGDLTGALADVRAVPAWQERLEPRLRDWLRRMEVWADVAAELSQRGLPLLTPSELDGVLSELDW